MGFAAFVLTARELACVSTVYYKMLRRLARGRASWEIVTPQGIEKRCLPNEQLCVLLKLPTLVTFLRVAQVALV